MKIFKAHAQGNDYLVAPVHPEMLRSDVLDVLSRTICHRRLGIGSDGIVFLHPSGESEVDLWLCRIFNPDGGEAEVSGNGVRCSAACISRMFPEYEGELIFQTPSGEKRLQLLDRKENRYIFQSDMGRPATINPNISDLAFPSPVSRGFDLQIEDRLFCIHPLSMGNPHCVIFIPDGLPADWEVWSTKIFRNGLFPHGTNMEWVQVESDDRIRVHFWERGVGTTLSSGSGSCAAGVMSILSGKTGKRVMVRNQIGSMMVEWHPPHGNVLLIGEAEIVLEGNYLAEPIF